MTDGLRPATPAPDGTRTHRQHLTRRPVRARIGGEWRTAVVTAQRQDTPDGPWEVCLEYRRAPGENVIGWFVADDTNITTPDDPGQS